MHYFNGGKSCVIGGMVNLTNYFDCVSIANDSFSSFVNYSFVNTTIVPLTDANLGVILQQELNESNYLMGAISRTDSDYRSNPFKFSDGHGYLVVGEWGRIFADGDATFRLTPFYQHIDNDGETNERNWGVAASIEYTLCDACTVYARSECRDCWARLYCSGGCAANAYHATGSVTGIYESGCELFKKRMECAIMLEVAKGDTEA